MHAVYKQEFHILQVCILLVKKQEVNLRLHPNEYFFSFLTLSLEKPHFELLFYIILSQTLVTS